MPVVPVNYFAILACGVASIAIGSLWYGPLFGKEWMKLMGYKAENKEAWKKDPKNKEKMMKTYGIQVLASLVMAYVMTHALVFASAFLKVSGVSAGLMTGFWNWLGFVVPITLGTVLWEGKPWKLWLINSSHYLATLCAMGVILSLWK